MGFINKTAPTQYNQFAFLNMLKQDKNIRKAIREGESYSVDNEIQYRAVLDFVQNKITESESTRKVLNSLLVSDDQEAVKEQLLGIIYTLLQKYPKALDQKTIGEFQTRILDDMTGFGILTPYLNDPNVEEINIFGPGDRQIEIVPAGGKPYKLEKGLETAEDVELMVKRMVKQGGETIDISNPRVDSYMSGGTRISAMISPVIRSDKGAVASIRKQTKATITIGDYIESLTGMEEEFEFLRLCVRNGISGATIGATGSGKTTMLNFLVSDYVNFNPERARVYIIEESREMQLPEDSKTIYTAVTPDGKITSELLLKSALRFHPSFICAAEMRGPEAMDALMAAQTGHIVWSTFHADNCIEAYDRLLMMCKLSGTDLSEDLLLRSLASSFPVIVSTQQLKDGKRRITGIFESEGLKDGVVSGHYIYKMQVEDYEYAEDGINVKHVSGYHMRVGDISDKLAQRIFDNCGRIDLVKKFAREGWTPMLPRLNEKMEDRRPYAKF